MEKVIAFLVVAVMVLAVALGVYWCIWSLWCWVMPQVWADGPAGFIAPGYWLFAGCWLLISLIGKAIFSSGKS